MKSSTTSTRSALIIALLASFLYSSAISAQGPPPAQPPGPKTYEPPSINAGGSFTSLEGRFSISLPSQTSGFGGLAIPTPFGIARGDAHNWKLKEASFIVGHADAAELVDTPEVAKQVFGGIRAQLKKIATENNGTIGEDKHLQLGKYPGIEQRVTLFSGVMVQRTYLVSRRLYQTLMIIKTTQREFENVAEKALDTFHVLTEAEIAAKLAEEVKKAEPGPLPQQPVAQRMGSDATDDGMRGQVKTVLEESQDLSGTWSVQTKKRDSFMQYNEQGNRVRRESYDYKGNLDQITVYGFIDGGRVSNFKTIQREYNPPPALVSVAPGAVVKKFDSRYQTRFEFKYDEQKRLIEHSLFHSNGERFLRYVYNYKGDQLESLVYSKDGSINQRSISTLDAKGNEIKRTSFDPRDNKPGATYSYVYEFDSHGNWTKRTTSKQVTKDERSLTEPQYVDFRTIIYW